ncbi:hypothetical protein MAR_034357 [Mya arenaria]|uniref:Uncharacterized protein n=1 Tax=Mya arenaria TaxID=6604 RepID=A0ABY7GCK4_MYAAR|nr:hypothetical protein MAR_034357 [Mya arenaria]
MKGEMYSFSKTTKSALIFELSFNETSKVMLDNFTCTPYITVIAINNALLSSSAICIEGITQPDRDSCTTVIHEEDKTVLAVSLSVSGAIAVIIGAGVVVVYHVMKRRRSKSEARKELRVSHHKENVSFERNEQENDIAHLPGIEEKPYENIPKLEGERISSVDNATYMNLQLKPS